ncbi:MAG: ABC transporter permease [Spirochaetota bacterium]
MQSQKSNRKKNPLDFLRYQEFLLSLVIIAIMVAMSFISPYFFTLQNIRGLLIGTTMVGIISVGMVGVLATGGLDLSVGSVLAFAGVIAGLSLKAGVPTIFAVIFALLAAGAVGLINGLCVAKLEFDPFITTLATMIMVRGFLLVISGGHAVTEMTESYNVLGQSEFLSFQYPVYYFFVIAILGAFFFHSIRIFRLTYYVGSNEEAARLSGINVALVKTLGYVIVAVLAGVSGVCMSARMGMASVTIGQATNLQVLAACVIGGSSFRGGQGTVLGAALGAFLLQLLVNSLNIAGMGIYWQQVFTGGVLLGAIALDRLKRW